MSKNEESFQCHVNPVFVTISGDEGTPIALDERKPVTSSQRTGKEAAGNTAYAEEKRSGEQAERNKPAATDADLKEKQEFLLPVRKEVIVCAHVNAVFLSHIFRSLGLLCG